MSIENGGEWFTQYLMINPMQEAGTTVPEFKNFVRMNRMHTHSKPLYNWCDDWKIGS